MGLRRRRGVQHRVGRVDGDRAAVDVPADGRGSAGPRGDGDGAGARRRLVRRAVPGGGASAGARLAYRCGRARREGARPAGAGLSRCDGRVAGVGAVDLRRQRLHLVGAVRPVLARCVAVVAARHDLGDKWSGRPRAPIGSRTGASSDTRGRPRSARYSRRAYPCRRLAAGDCRGPRIASGSRGPQRSAGVRGPGARTK